MPTLDWIGKKAVVAHHKNVPFHLLRSNDALSVGESGSGNLLVQGDNLLALKALLPYYAGKVKCIYIDPPYNTGNEGWVYNDNVNSPEMRDWLGRVVGKEAEDLSRHDKWLCMMYPRLALLKEFLREDGAIFVSIDDNEVANLRLLLNEIFGVNNFVATIIWQKKYAVANDHKSIAPMHDFILVFQKSSLWKRNLFPRTQEKDRQYRYKDQDGIFRISDYTCNKTAEERPNLYYSILNPYTGKEVWPKQIAVWRYSRERHEENVNNRLVFWGKDGKAKVPSFKRYQHMLKNAGGIVPQTLWLHDFAGHTDAAKKEVRAILSENTQAFDFVTPKPTTLLSRIFQIATDKDSLVLDSFAGSGTTGQAVLAQNQVDGGNRRFILVEMDKHICQNVTAQRLSRVIHGYKDVPALGGSFRFCELGIPLFDTDGQINKDVSFKDLAHHVFFAATGEPLAEHVDFTSPLIGSTKGIAVYLLYNGILNDKSVNGGNVLTRDVLSKLPTYDGIRIIYGNGCRIGTDRLQRENIIFRQIPYDVRTK